jgi:hypothetical protein
MLYRSQSSTIVSYNAGIVQFYNSTNSLVRFKIKHISFSNWNAPAYLLLRVVVVNTEVAVLAHGWRVVHGYVLKGTQY